MTNNEFNQMLRRVFVRVNERSELVPLGISLIHELKQEPIDPFKVPVYIFSQAITADEVLPYIEELRLLYAK